MGFGEDCWFLDCSFRFNCGKSLSSSRAPPHPFPLPIGWGDARTVRGSAFIYSKYV
jgi:hypothetical protein